MQVAFSCSSCAPGGRALRDAGREEWSLYRVSMDGSGALGLDRSADLGAGTSVVPGRYPGYSGHGAIEKDLYGVP